MTAQHQFDLSAAFSAVCFKRLRAVEVSRESSNQHELNGVSEIRTVLGEPNGTQRLPVRLIYLADEENERLSCEEVFTWYDARAEHPTRSELRLYYRTNPVFSEAREGDLLFLGRLVTANGLDLVGAIAPSGSTAEFQLLTLLRRPDLFDAIPGPASARALVAGEVIQPGSVAAYLLEELQIDPAGFGLDFFPQNAAILDEMIRTFGDEYPTTREFSHFARERSGHPDPVADPDSALLTWFEFEEELFRLFERRIIDRKIESGELKDPDRLVSFALSILNRRKSRAGLALENHVEEILIRSRVPFDRGGRTEGRSRPDFLIPSQKAYHDASFPYTDLFMLGVKTTCKDRWRQVLAEAERIPVKHLLTLEPGISPAQLAEMERNSLSLVVPAGRQEFYPPEQKGQLTSLRDFIGLVDTE